MKAGELNKILTQLSKLKRGNIPAEDYAYLSGGTLRCFSMKSRTVHLMVNCDLLGEGLIPISEIQKLCAKVKDRDISFGFEPESCKVLLDGVKKFTFSTMPLEHYPAFFEIVESEMRLDLDVNLIKRAAKYTSNDELRLALTGVFIDHEYVAATDANTLVYFKHNQEIDFSVIIPAEVVTCLSSNVRMMVSSKTNDNYWFLVTDTETICFSLIDSMYPNFRSVIPDESAIHMEVGVKEFSEELDLALLSTNKETFHVELVLNESVRVLSRDIDRGAKFESQIDASFDGDIHIAFNGRFMQKIIKDAIGKNLSMGFSTPSKAIVINDECLLMPVMISKGGHD